MQSIPPVHSGNQFLLVRATLPADGDDTSPYELVLHVAPHWPCPHCGENHAVRQATKPVVVYDLPWGDHPVKLTVTEGVMTCGATKARVPCRYPGRSGSVTDALARFIVRRRGREPQRELAQRIGVGPGVVQRAHDRAKLLAAIPHPPPPEEVPQLLRLGLDDIYIAKGRYMVAVDLDTQRILDLARVSAIEEGKADQFDLEGFFKQLPEAGVIALDMHAEQMQAVKARWPNATIVIDKRHLLKIVDRDLLTLATHVVLGRWEDDPITQRQVVRQFGSAAYPYLSLQSLVLRRSRHLTPADLATWAVLRAEGRSEAGAPPRPAQILWEAYLYREALYDLYDETRPPEQFAQGLTLWRTTVEAWSDRGKDGNRPLQTPLGRIVWALKEYEAECLAYATTGLTNANTEFVNSQIRRHLRRGHRFDRCALILLVNRDAEARHAERLPQPKPVIWEAPVPELEPSAQQKPKRPYKPRRTPRGRSQRVDDLRLTDDIWMWLHTPLEPHRRSSRRWVHRVLEQLSSGEQQIWQMYSAGQVQSPQGLTVSPQHLERWRGVVHHLYVAEHIDQVNGKERARQVALRDLRMEDLALARPELHQAACQLYNDLADTVYIALSPEQNRVMAEVAAWHMNRA